MRWAVLGVLCACNQVFGLKPTQALDASPPIDAQFFDAPADAPFSCPPGGMTPRFSTVLHQTAAQNCSDYTISSSRHVAAAVCNDGSFVLHAAEGPVDEALTPLIGFDDPTFELQFLRLAPEGDEAWGTYYSTSAMSYQFRIYRRQSNGSWVRGPDFGTASAFLALTAPTRRPNRHVLQSGLDGHLHEFVENTGGAWNELTNFTSSELGVTYLGSPSLSADGLRLLLYTAPLNDPVPRVMYSDRPTINARFRLAEPVQGVPHVSDVYLTDDCSRIYFSGLDSVFYVQQQ